MVKEHNVKGYCCEDISNVENYDKAIADTTQTWDCHHRLELIATGGVCDVTVQDLKGWNLYYGRPADELIFLTRAEHSILHKKGKPSGMKGKHLSEETRRKMSEVRKGKLSPTKGKHYKLVDGKRVWY